MTPKAKIGLNVPVLAIVAVVLFVLIRPDRQHPLEIENGSYWTDGNWYCEITQEDTLIRLTGYTLHEGGMDGTLTPMNDSLAYISEGDIFAPVGSIVRLQHYVLEDGTSCQFLVAYSDKSLTKPIAALQRFDGDEEAFEQSAYHRLLAGTYTPEDANSPQYIFYSDGTVRLSPDAAPEPYTIETLYHALTDVISLPDGRHIGIALNNDYLFLFDTEWDEVEEVWMAQEEVAQRLKRENPFPWQSNQLFCGPMAHIMFNEWIESEASQALTSPDPFTRLNAHLMQQYIAD